MQPVATWVNINNANGLPDNGILEATDADPWFWDNGNNQHGDNAFTTDITSLVGGTLDVQLLKKQNGPTDSFFDFDLLDFVDGTNDLSIVITDLASPLSCSPTAICRSRRYPSRRPCGCSAARSPASPRCAAGRAEPGQAETPPFRHAGARGAGLRTRSARIRRRHLIGRP